MLLFGLRSAIAAAAWMLPVIAVSWRLVRCGNAARIGSARAVVRLHVDFKRAIVTSWSAPLLFVGSALFGFGYAFGSAGDAARLVSRNPAARKAFDVATDAIAAVLSFTGMSLVLVATSQRRTASLLVSAALIGTGIGTGVVTL